MKVVFLLNHLLAALPHCTSAKHLKCLSLLLDAFLYILYPAISIALTEKALQLCPDVESSERTDETEKIDWNSDVAFNRYSNIFKSYIPIQLPIFSRKKSARDLRSEVNIFLK